MLHLDRAMTALRRFDPGASHHAESADEWISEKGVILANWNDVPQAFCEGLEAEGYDIGWSDQYSTCDVCGRLVRVQPDSYSWQPRAYIDGALAICADCIREDPTDYIDAMKNKHKCAVWAWLDLEGLGWLQKSTDHEAGWHPHQTASPEVLAQTVPDGFDYLFQIDWTGQFDTGFSLWIKAKEG